VVVVIPLEQEVYALESYSPFGLNAEHQAYVKQILQETLDRIENQTAQRMIFFDDGDLVIAWDASTTATTAEGNVIEVPNEIELWTLHNFTAGRGYDFTGSAIIAPNGTELFSD
jgi:predicted ATP-grasp superfamily ATP-dependent carboligase